MENSKKIILATGLIAIILSLFSNTACRAGWEYHNETHYKCVTKSGERYQICFNVYNSANTENYWCKKGEIVKEEKVEEFIPQIHSGDIHCNNIGKCW